LTATVSNYRSETCLFFDPAASARIARASGARGHGHRASLASYQPRTFDGRRPAAVSFRGAFVESGRQAARVPDVVAERQCLSDRFERAVVRREPDAHGLDVGGRAAELECV